MANKTPFLDLYKKDPILDKADTFNIKTMLNENWDKLDLAMLNFNKNKVDEIEGKGLSSNDFTTILKNKLEGIDEGASKYKHPLTHPPSIIEQDADNRFISDLELAQIENNKKGLGTHVADVTNEQGRHGIRYFNEKLEIKSNGEWLEIKNNADDPNSWEGIQNIVRKGKANEFFSVGDQIISSYGTGQIIWEIIGIDVDTPANNTYSHSLTLQTKDCLHDVQFDAPEPSNPDSNRKTNGNNRYIHSALKQWLNSNEVSFNWQSQHQYDVRPSSTLNIYDSAGFLNRLDPELTAVIGLAKKNVAKNTVTDGGGQESFADKVFLLSQKEVDLGEEGVITGESVYPFYNGVANAGRIKQLNGSPRIWWLRSPHVGTSHYVRVVTASGGRHYYSAGITYGVSPACVII